MAKGLTPAQRVWLRELGVIVGTPAGASELHDARAPVALRGQRLLRPAAVSVRRAPADDLDGELQAQVRQKLTETDLVPDALPPQDVLEKEGFVPDPSGLGSDVIDIIKKLGGGRRICAIQVVNKTSRVIHRGVAKHESGDYQKLPPDTIEPGGKAEFVAASPEPLPLDIPSEGAIGRQDWLLDGDTTWFIKWSNPVAGSNESETDVIGINRKKFLADKLNGNGNTAEYRFTLTELGKPPTPPPPKPQPQPGEDLIQASCLIQVINKTKQHTLLLTEAGHERGDFMARPSELRIAPDEKDDSIISFETPRATDDGCKGFIEYQVGEPGIATWRVEWDNPEGQKNTATATITPPTAPLRSLETISQGDENVRVAFVLSDGGGGQGPPPVPPIPPVPPVPPQPTKTFTRPPEARQPTLRHRDKSPDGWVEYLQKRLNETINAGLVVDGDFGSGTLKAVIEFQKRNKLKKIDGIVGNETWSALREGPREEPGTDGRRPHSFVEGGPEGRWNTEKQDAEYATSTDTMVMHVVSVGTSPIDKFTATVKVTPPGGTPSVQDFPIGPPDKTTPTGAGNEHSVKIQGFKKIFPPHPSNPNAKVSDYTLEAFLEEEIGGDHWIGRIVER